MYIILVNINVLRYCYNNHRDEDHFEIWYSFKLCTYTCKFSILSINKFYIVNCVLYINIVKPITYKVVNLFELSNDSCSHASQKLVCITCNFKWKLFIFTCLLGRPDHVYIRWCRRDCTRVSSQWPFFNTNSIPRT